VQTERIVPREEPPVAQPVAPPGPVPMGSRAGLPVPPSMAVAPAVAPAGEPKRVRTVTIRQEPNPDTTQTTRPTSQTPPRAATPKQNAGAPLAIAPAAETPPTRTVARTVPPAAPVADGSYIVQVSAQKTEGEAQSSYRAMQAKYPAVLAGREASIRRADLGDKGVYYRAQIGPFANAAAANTFCDNLKAAGGQCIVQKN
jgi:cell division septation protein DedD